VDEWGEGKKINVYTILLSHPAFSGIHVA